MAGEIKTGPEEEVDAVSHIPRGSALSCLPRSHRAARLVMAGAMAA